MGKIASRIKICVFGSKKGRIYVQRHTPRKGIRLILDTVSRMRGRATQFDQNVGPPADLATSHRSLSPETPSENAADAFTCGYRRGDASR